MTCVKLLLIVIAVLIPVCAALLTACVDDTTGVAPVPASLTRDHACRVCGMIIVDFPGAKAQIHYRDGTVDYFCSTLDMFVFYRQPGRPPHIEGVFVNDMGKADWDHPHDHWINARTAYYVYGGDVMGPMGEALAPFSEMEDAEKYTARHGGEIVSFNDVTMEMLRPDVHD